MSLVAAKCPSCGGEIQLEEEREKGFCLYCGSQIDIQKELNSERPNITGSDQDILNWKSAFDKYMAEFMYDKAEKMADKIMQANPDDPDAIFRYKTIMDARKLSITEDGSLWGFIHLTIVDDYGDEVNAFEDIEEVYIPNVVKRIESEAFMGYRNLKRVYLPIGLLSIESKAFMFCNSLREINMPTSVTDIGDYAFSGCVLLSESIIPNTVTTVGHSIFRDYSSEAIKEVMDIIIPGLKSKDHLVLPSGIDHNGFVIRKRGYDLMLRLRGCSECYKGKLSFKDLEGKAELSGKLYQGYHGYRNLDINQKELADSVFTDIIEVLRLNKLMIFDGAEVGEFTMSLVTKTEMVDVVIKSYFPRTGNKFELEGAEESKGIVRRRPLFGNRWSSSDMD